MNQSRPWVVCEGAQVHELCSGPRSIRGKRWFGFHGFSGAEQRLSNLRLIMDGECETLSVN